MAAAQAGSGAVGSGERNRPISLKSAQGALEWAVPIIDVLFDGNTDSVDYIAQQLMGDGYFRLQTELLIGLDDIDDTRATNIAVLEIMAKQHLARPATAQMLKALAARL